MFSDERLRKIELNALKAEELIERVLERINRVEETYTQRQELIRDVVRQTLIEIGIEKDSPLEMQRDFVYLRRWRMTHERMGFRAAATLITLLIGGLIAALWAGFRVFLEY